MWKRLSRERPLRAIRIWHCGANDLIVIMEVTGHMCARVEAISARCFKLRLYHATAIAALGAMIVPLAL